MKKIQLTGGQTAIVDGEDFPLVDNYKWHAVRRGPTYYALATIRENGKSILLRMHRLILHAPANIQIDHIDGDGLNNQRINLRFASNQQNSWNRKSHRWSSSQYKGVSWDKEKEQWEVHIAIDGKSMHLGRFVNETEAALAYNKMAKQLFGEFAYLNNVGVAR